MCPVRLTALLLLLAAAHVAAARDWPTLHGDLQRSGFAPDFPRGDLRLAWRQDLSAEMTAPRAEVIVADGVAFIGTLRGRLHAIDARTGTERWVLDCGAPIGHSVSVGDGSVHVATADGKLRSVSAEDGRIQWSLRVEAGFWTAPVWADGWIFLGDRAGVFRAFDARRDGHEVWRVETGGPILTPASLSRDGSRVFFGSEDMRVRCVQVNTGQVLWTSEKLPGATLRDYAPTVAGDLVFVTTNPVADFHAVLDENERFLVSRSGFTGADPRYIAGTEADVTAEQDAIVAHLRENPHHQCFHALRASDGSPPWIAPILYTAGCHNVMTPPCVDPRSGAVHVLLRSAYSVWDGGGEVRSFTTPGVLDPATGRVRLLGHSHPAKDASRPPGAPDLPWDSFNMIGDEAQALSCAPGRLFSHHQGTLGVLDLDTGRVSRLFGKRDTYGGFFGPGTFGWEKDGGPAKAAEAGEPYGLANEWHGPARSIASVADGRVFYHTGSQILCLTAAQP